MSRPSNDAEVLDTLLAQLVARGGAAIALLAAPAAQTSGLVAVTYTTDDPAVTADGTLVVADGDAVTIAENYEGFEELNDQNGKLVADMTAIRTALAAAIAGGSSNATAPAAMTGRDVTLAVSYTTDDPSITPNAAVVIADGDTVVDEEYHEAIVELATEYDLVSADVQRLHAAVTTLILQPEKAPVLAARSSTAAGIAVTYTTDDPAYTPDGSFTVADGDLMTAANGTSYIEELNNDLDFLGDDYAAMKTAYDLYLGAIGRPTS
jgi:hypothetical protein